MEQVSLSFKGRGREGRGKEGLFSWDRKEDLFSSLKADKKPLFQV
jgi:hypothetical protein